MQTWQGFPAGATCCRSSPGKAVPDPTLVPAASGAPFRLGPRLWLREAGGGLGRPWARAEGVGAPERRGKGKIMPRDTGVYVTWQPWGHGTGQGRTFLC